MTVRPSVVEEIEVELTRESREGPCNKRSQYRGGISRVKFRPLLNEWSVFGRVMEKGERWTEEEGEVNGVRKAEFTDPLRATEWVVRHIIVLVVDEYRGRDVCCQGPGSQRLSDGPRPTTRSRVGPQGRGMVFTETTPFLRVGRGLDSGPRLWTSPLLYFPLWSTGDERKKNMSLKYY